MSPHFRLPALLLVALCALALPARAQDDETKDEKSKDEEAEVRSGQGLLEDYEGEVTGRGLWYSNREKAGRYLEYRDLPRGGVLDLFRFQNRRKVDDLYYFKAEGRDVSQEDQRVDLSAGRYGMFDLNVRWDRIPHRFGNDAITLYRGIGTGRLTIDDTVQQDLQAATNANNQAFRLGRHLDESQHLRGLDDVMLQREQVHGDMKWYWWDPLRLSLDVDFERRDGVRPTFGSFGFANTVQILEPIDYQTFGTRAAVSYAQGPVDAEGWYRLQTFNNGEESLTWDNPFRLTDSATLGPATGRMALDADNQMHELGLKSGYQIAERTRVSGNASWAFTRSSTDLQPYTSNTALVRTRTLSPPFDAFDPAALGQHQFTGKKFTQNYDLNFTTRPWDPVEFKAYGRYQVVNDLRETIAFPGHVRTDSTWLNAAPTIAPESYDRSKAVGGLKTTVHLPWILSRLKPGYEFEAIFRDGRQVETTYEHESSLDLETDWLDWLSTDVGFAYGHRDARDFTPPEAAEALRFLRQFDTVDRNRWDFHTDATFAPWTWVDTTIGYRFEHEDYFAKFGLTETERQTVSGQATFHPADDVDVTTYASREDYDTRQGGRQWTPGAQGDPSTPRGVFEENVSNWTAHFEEEVYTIGLHPTWRFAPGWHVTGGYTTVWNETRIGMASRQGAPIDDANPYEPGDLRQADDSQRHSLNLEFGWEPHDSVQVFAGYGLDMFRSTSDFRRGLTSAPQLPSGAYAGAYLLGLEYDDAEVHLGYFGVNIKF